MSRGDSITDLDVNQAPAAGDLYGANSSNEYGCMHARFPTHTSSFSTPRYPHASTDTYMEKDEFGEIGYAVIDVEALLLGPVKVVEQLGCVIMSASDGAEVFAEKHMVYQPYDAEGLVRHYGQPPEVVRTAMDGYTMVTGDDPLHDDPARFPSWSAVRNRIRKILKRRAIRVYAKGAALERTVFGSALEIFDLEWTGCPRYPEKIHDPLEECRFFARFIPEFGAKKP